MDYIYGKLEWNNNYDVESSSDSRKKLYDIISNYLDEIEPCDLTKKLKVLQRIGSNSKYGEVFLLKFDIKNIEIEKFAALKVMPIINKNSYDKNENEMRIALSASTLVLEGNSKYFSLVYFFDECKETFFYNDEYNIKSREYQNVSDTEGVKSNILISELAKEDLFTYISKNYKNLTYDDWIKLINHCMKAINDMHYKLNVIHNDLHLRNFLIINSENGIIPLIHDFGSSEFVNEDEIKLYNYDTLDINFFLQNILDLENEIGNINDSKEFNKVKFYVNSLNKQSLSEKTLSSLRVS